MCGITGFIDFSAKTARPELIAMTDALKHRGPDASGYFYNIPYSHIPNIKASFPVDKASFRLSKLPNAKALTYTDAAGQIFFVMIYSDKPGKDNRYQATVCKIYKSDGLAWNNNYALAFNPKEIAFKAETGELTVKGESLQSIIDKNGKLLK